MTEYPYPGCCPHSFNTHTRDHCLGCNCAKPPTQVGTPTTEPNPPELDLRTCGTCHALVLDAERETHLDWHTRQLDTIANIIRALADLSDQFLSKETQ